MIWLRKVGPLLGIETQVDYTPDLDKARITAMRN